MFSPTLGLFYRKQINYQVFFFFGVEYAILNYTKCLIPLIREVSKQLIVEKKEN